MRKSSILGQFHGQNWIPGESEFQSNPNERHQQPIPQDDASIPQEVRECLNAILKNNFHSIVSKSSTDTGRTKLFEMDIPMKDYLLHVDPTLYP